MTKRIIFNKPDGSCSIIVPSPRSKLTMEEHARKVIPAGTPYDIVDVSEISSDRTFRNAWEATSGHVVINMGKARDVARFKIRAARGVVLSALDLEIVRGLEPDTPSPVPAEIQARKNVARDAPADPRLEAATDHDSLKQAMADVVTEMEALVKPAPPKDPTPGPGPVVEPPAPVEEPVDPA